MRVERAHNGKPKRILLVDDAADLREVYRLALEDEGYEVREAPGAEQALALAHDWRPDLVLTDIFMPGMGGFELITRILAVRASVGSKLEVGASAELTFEAPIPCLTPDVLLKWAGEVLVRATSSGSSECLAVSACWTPGASSVAPSPHV